MFKKLLITIIGFFLVSYIVSYFLPSRWSVKRTIEIEASADKIFPLINNLQNWGRWYPWTKSMDVSMVITYEGPQAGPGAVRKWSGSSVKPGRIEITQSVVNQSVSYIFTSEGNDLAVTGSLNIQPVKPGCIVIWEDKGDIKMNIVARLFSGSIDGIIGPKFEEGLAKLKKAAENK